MKPSASHNGRQEGAIIDASLPTGTITFLFSDIEGSTKLLNRLGRDYPRLLEDHQRLLREAFAAGRGVEVATEGDSFFVVFPSAAHAVASAIAAQRALAGHSWPEGAEVRVRMGLHTGEAVLGADNYVGIDVHRAARIAGAGHGGQVVLSQATRALVEQSLPEGATLRDLGEHRLKDLAHPERLFQVAAEGLRSEFPPPRSLDVRPTNLPQQLTTFIGRHQELAEVKAALEESRLLTLTGPGGTGKTRLSLETAAEVLDRFADGVFFVALAPITEPGLVVPTIAQALGLAEDPRRAPAEVLIEHLEDKELLLVLDNFEQVMGAAPPVGEVLGATDRVKTLVTSREPLGLHGEREYPVPPLGVPDVDHLPSLGSLSQYEAVTLFIDRAKAVNPGFTITEENAPAVAEVTARLDGLPLAIELAAARSKILAPQAMLKRLDHRLSLLAGGARDRPGRQRTLRDAIAWSYDLLDEEEGTLFARLSVFVGGFTLGAVEEVCAPDGESELDAFEGVASLVNKSLLRQVEGTGDDPRFLMLETIREYASELLAGRPDADGVRARHAAHFQALAERAAPELTGENQVTWLDMLAREHGNLRSALAWAAESDVPGGLRLAFRLWRFWQIRGHLREARERLEDLLARPGAGDPAARADGLEGLGGVAYWMGDWTRSLAAYEECLRLRREGGDPAPLAHALYNLASVLVYAEPGHRDVDRAEGLLGEAMDLYRQVGSPSGEANAMWALAGSYFSRALSRGASPKPDLLERAVEMFHRSLTLYREAGDRFGEGWALHMLGAAETGLGRHEEALRHIAAALELFRAADDRSAFPLMLADLSLIASRRGRARQAIRLYGAAQAQEDAIGTGITSTDTEFYRDAVAAARAELSAGESEALDREGRAMELDEALSYGFRDDPD
ncbi:MAG: ATP-binding protein [Actinomycetota bacterium]